MGGRGCPPSPMSCIIQKKVSIRTREAASDAKTFEKVRGPTLNETLSAVTVHVRIDRTFFS